MTTLGSLCTGYGGLDLAVETLWGIQPTWVSEIDRDANTVLAQRYPHVPNIGDLRHATPPPVDIVTAGFPCQPVSHAGKQRGHHDERWLWDDIAACVGRMDPPPRLLLLENVAGLLTANDGHAMASVVQGLAGMGYVGSWGVVRAYEIGAPHSRARVFIAAAHPHIDRSQVVGGVQPRLGSQHHPDRRGQNDRDAAAHPHVTRPQRQEPAERPDLSAWGDYAPGIERWAATIGRPPPAPTVPGNPRQLDPRFVEWMMGLEPGWVTDVGLTRTAQLRILGNGVVPQQAAHAYTRLLEAQS